MIIILWFKLCILAPWGSLLRENPVVFKVVEARKANIHKCKILAFYLATCMWKRGVHSTLGNESFNVLISWITLQIEFVDSLPKTVSGKIRRVELRQKEWS